MFNEFEAAAFLLLGPFPEAVTGMTSGFRQSNISCLSASYFSPRKKACGHLVFTSIHIHTHCGVVKEQIHGYAQ